MRAFFIDSIICSKMNVVQEREGKYCGFNYTYSCKGDLFPPVRSLQIILYIFVFLCVYFSGIRLRVRGSMELVKVKKFVMVGSRWMLEAVTDHAVKKTPLWLDPGGGQNQAQIKRSRRSWRLSLQWGLYFRSVSFMFDLVVAGDSRRGDS